MSKALDGLKAALTRNASGNVIALAEMETGDILAGLSDEQKTALATALAPAAAAGAAPAAPANAAATPPEDDEQPDEGDDEEEAPPAAAQAAADAGERARVKAVAKAVAEDETCKGKAGLALTMLADDDYATLSASGIVKLLGKSGADDTVADPDAAARAEMRDTIAQTGNSGIDATGAGKADANAQSASVWDQAIAANNPRPSKAA